MISWDCHKRTLLITCEGLESHRQFSSVSTLLGSRQSLWARTPGLTDHCQNNKNSSHLFPQTAFFLSSRSKQLYSVSKLVIRLIIFTGHFSPFPIFPISETGPTTHCILSHKLEIHTVVLSLLTHIQSVRKSGQFQFSSVCPVAISLIQSIGIFGISYFKHLLLGF